MMSVLRHHYPGAFRRPGAPAVSPRTPYGASLQRLTYAAGGTGACLRVPVCSMSVCVYSAVQPGSAQWWTRVWSHAWKQVAFYTSYHRVSIKTLMLGFFAQAVPFTNQTRLIFESVLPLLPHRRRIPSPLSQSRRRSLSPRVASRERGQNAPSKKGQSVKPDSCINLRRSKIPPGCPDGA